MKKIICFIVFFSVCFLFGCTDSDSVNPQSILASPTSSSSSTLTASPTPVSPTTGITTAKTPVATPTPTPYYTYPNSYYDENAWEKLTNYKFNSVSGVDEKKREDFSTTDEFNKHIKNEVLNKYNRLKNYLEQNINNIDALYVHCNLLDNKGNFIRQAKMDVIITDVELIRQWACAVLEFPIIENEHFTSENINSRTGCGSTFVFCLDIDGEIIEFFEGSSMGITYSKAIPPNEYAYYGDRTNNSDAYERLYAIESKIYSAAYERFMEIYKNPINYPYILE